MPNTRMTIEYDTLPDMEALDAPDRALLLQAREATEHAYAPYSRFHVAAVARLTNGATLAGTNQENASYPVGICAERTLLSAISSVHQGAIVHTIAISYKNHAGGESNKPASPCGLCRQSLLEYEQRQGHPIRLILAGFSGPILIISRVADLLPFGFGPDDLLS